MGGGGRRISGHVSAGRFLMKDFLFLAASFYLLKQDLTREAREMALK
jgi:uncharacterized membrane protein YkgB